MRRENHSSALSFENFPFLSEEIASSTFLLPHTEHEELLECLCLDVEIGKMLEPWVNWTPPGYKAGEINTLRCRLYPLQTTGDGNCLLQACLLSMVGNHDKEQMLRENLMNALLEESIADHFKEVWLAWDALSDATVGEACFEQKEAQIQNKWEDVVATALRPENFLGAFHIYMLAHILKRPIIVYGDAFIRGPKGERASPNTLRGVFLPNQLPVERTCKVPIAIGYTIPCAGQAGHFAALVGMENNIKVMMLVDQHGESLPVHFMPQSDAFGNEQMAKEYHLQKYVETFYFQTKEGENYLCCKIVGEDGHVLQAPECPKVRLKMIKTAHDMLQEQAKTMEDIADKLVLLADQQEKKIRRENKRLFQPGPKVDRKDLPYEHRVSCSRKLSTTYNDSIATIESNAHNHRKDTAQSGSQPPSCSSPSSQDTKTIKSSITTEQNRMKDVAHKTWSFTKGDRVEARCSRGMKWIPAEVLNVNRGLIHVAYDDGSFDRALKPEHVRLKPAEQDLTTNTRTAHNMASVQEQNEIFQSKSQQYEEEVLLKIALKMSLKEENAKHSGLSEVQTFIAGDRVDVRWGGSIEWVPARVVLVKDGLLSVFYDNGQLESEVNPKYVRLQQKDQDAINSLDQTDTGKGYFICDSCQQTLPSRHKAKHEDICQKNATTKASSYESTADITEKFSKMKLSESSSEVPTDSFKPGDIVEAQWPNRCGKWYGGKVEKVLHDGSCEVTFDDGTYHLVQQKLIRLKIKMNHVESRFEASSMFQEKLFKPGDIVEALWPNCYSIWYDGKIDSVFDDGSCGVAFSDGTYSPVKQEHIRLKYKKDDNQPSYTIPQSHAISAPMLKGTSTSFSSPTGMHQTLRNDTHLMKPSAGTHSLSHHHGPVKTLKFTTFYQDESSFMHTNTNKSVRPQPNSDARADSSAASASAYEPRAHSPAWHNAGSSRSIRSSSRERLYSRTYS